MKTYKTPVMASKLIQALEAKGRDADVVDRGDLAPYLRTVTVCVDEETHECSLSGRYGYMEDSARYGVDPGRSEAVVLGVTFSKPVMDACDNEIELGGREIEYDNDLTEDDVLAVADEQISFPEYDPDDYPFDENEVTDEDILRCLEWDVCAEAFAINNAGMVCAFESEEDVPKRGYSIITEDEANKRLAHDRPGLEYDIEY